MSKFKIKIEEDEYDATIKMLVDMAIETRTHEDCRALLRLVQLFLNGEWEEA